MDNEEKPSTPIRIKLILTITNVIYFLTFFSPLDSIKLAT
jgi:hypothetical protein